MNLQALSYCNGSPIWFMAKNAQGQRIRSNHHARLHLSFEDNICSHAKEWADQEKHIHCQVGMACRMRIADPPGRTTQAPPSFAKWDKISRKELKQRFGRRRPHPFTSSGTPTALSPPLPPPLSLCSRNPEGSSPSPMNWHCEANGLDLEAHAITSSSPIPNRRLRIALACKKSYFSPDGTLLR